MRSFKSLLGIMAVAVVGVTVNTGTAQAAPSFCVPGPNSDTLLTSDVTFRGSAADDCYGVLSDNALTLSEINQIWNITVNPGDYKYGMGNFGSPLYANGDSVDFAGLNWDFDLTSNGSGTFGSWDLEVRESGASGPFPTTIDILFLVQDDDKNPDNWAMYLFNDETFNNLDDVDGNSWAIGWMNGNTTPNYDKALLLFRNGTPTTGGETTSGDAAVPEPASLLLLGSGLGAAAMRARRRKQNS